MSAAASVSGVSKTKPWSITLPKEFQDGRCDRQDRGKEAAQRQDAEREFKVYRWNPDDGSNPRLDTY